LLLEWKREEGEGEVERETDDEAGIELREVVQREEGEAGIERREVRGEGGSKGKHDLREDHSDTKESYIEREGDLFDLSYCKRPDE
jgi:hypothetical protein